MDHVAVEAAAIRVDGDRFSETRHHVLRQLHLRQRKQEGQRGFRSLVPVDPIYMQSIAAAAGLGRVEFRVRDRSSR